jgi:hypothetical protein
MSGIYGIGYAAFGLLVLASCSSQSINFDYDRQAKFANYKTYAWYEGEHTIADEDPLAHQRFVAAVDRELAAKGFGKVSSNPDVYVTYYADDQENTVIDTNHFGYGYGSDWYWGGGMGMGMGSSTSTVRTYTQGTLVLDMWDASAEQLVWRGIVSDTVSNDPAKNAQKIERAAAKLFERYPPTGS